MTDKNAISKAVKTVKDEFYYAAKCPVTGKTLVIEHDPTRGRETELSRRSCNFLPSLSKCSQLSRVLKYSSFRPPVMNDFFKVHDTQRRLPIQPEIHSFVTFDWEKICRPPIARLTKPIHLHAPTKIVRVMLSDQPARHV
jgi:hypothetical protein